MKVNSLQLDHHQVRNSTLYNKPTDKQHLISLCYFSLLRCHHACNRFSRYETRSHFKSSTTVVLFHFNRSQLVEPFFRTATVNIHSREIFSRTTLSRWFYFEMRTGVAGIICVIQPLHRAFRSIVNNLLNNEQRIFSKG